SMNTPTGVSARTPRSIKDRARAFAPAISCPKVKLPPSQISATASGLRSACARTIAQMVPASQSVGGLATCTFEGGPSASSVESDFIERTTRFAENSGSRFEHYSPSLFHGDRKSFRRRETPRPPVCDDPGIVDVCLFDLPPRWRFIEGFHAKPRNS